MSIVDPNQGLFDYEKLAYCTAKNNYYLFISQTSTFLKFDSGLELDIFVKAADRNFPEFFKKLIEG